MQRPSPRIRASVRSLLATSVLAQVLFVSGPAGAVSDPQRVIAGPEDQLLPSANADHLLWTANSETFPNRYHAFARPRGSTDVFRLNPAGTRGYAGGLFPDRPDEAVYQQIDGESSDLYRIDLVTRERRRLPALVNSSRWEWGPRVSEAFFLFARDAGSTTTLFLFDRVERTLEKIASYDLTTYYAPPGSVGERYATWTVCGPFTCRAFVHDTLDGVTRRIPAPDGSARYAPVVHETEAQVYFVRSGQACGASVRIVRVPVADLGSAPEPIATLPAGIDVGFQLSLEDRTTTANLWFSRYRCAPEQGDIFVLKDIATP